MDTVVQFVPKHVIVKRLEDGTTVHLVNLDAMSASQKAQHFEQKSAAAKEEKRKRKRKGKKKAK